MRLTPSTGRAKSVRQFLLQILNTTLAVLIALSFEGLVEWRRIRNLVSTAREHMQNEIRSNRKDLAGIVSVLPEIEARAKERLQVTEAVLAARAAAAAGESRPAAADPPWDLRLINLVLGATSRSTAEATGALGHMDYAEVKRFSEAYTMQQEVMRLRERYVDSQAAAILALRGDLTEKVTSQVESAHAATVAWVQALAEFKSHSLLLLKFYDQALKSGQP